MSGLNQVVPPSVLSVTGLDQVAVPKPAYTKRLEYVRKLVDEDPKLGARTVKLWVQNHDQ